VITQGCDHETRAASWLGAVLVVLGEGLVLGWLAASGESVATGAEETAWRI